MTRAPWVVTKPGKPFERGHQQMHSTSLGWRLVNERHQTPMNLRGRFTTGADGTYTFGSVRPVAYSIPDDGPVGEMLRAGGRHNWRPAHTHFVVAAPEHKTAITHLFDAGLRLPRFRHGARCARQHRFASTSANSSVDLPTNILLSAVRQHTGTSTTWDSQRDGCRRGTASRSSGCPWTQRIDRSRRTPERQRQRRRPAR